MSFIETFILMVAAAVLSWLLIIGCIFAVVSMTEHLRDKRLFRKRTSCKPM